jgi:putative GTP pyrophosphokinase
MAASTNRKAFTERYGPAPAAIIVDPNERFNKKRADFREFYSGNLAIWENAREAFSSVLSLLTSELPTGKPKVVSRVKRRDECVRKFELKYRNEIEKTKTDYQIQDYISDIIGIRIICLYEDDVAEVHKIIKRHFEIIGTTDKTKTLIEDHNKFGYKGLHLDIRLNGARQTLPEYAPFQNLQIEIQIRSIVQDAWSEIDHRLKYKKSIPDALKRRVVRLAALFELADQEFTTIRKDTEVLEVLVSEDRSTSSVENFLLLDDRVIDSFSFIAVMKKHFSFYNFDNAPDSESSTKIDGFVEDVRSMDPWLTDAEFKSLMDDFVPKISRYRDIIAKGGSVRMNPFTLTRHILYWYDRDKFSDSLYPNQKKSFEGWLATIDRD